MSPRVESVPAARKCRAGWRRPGLAGHERARLPGTWRHLLLGLLEERTGPAAQSLLHLGVTTERVRQLLMYARTGV